MRTVRWMMMAILVALIGVATPGMLSGQQPLWIARLPNSNGNTSVADLSSDNSSFCLVGRFFFSATFDYDYLTAFFYPDGQFAWYRTYRTMSNNLDEALAVAHDFVGNVIVTGASYTQGDGYNIVTIKYSFTGSTLWTRSYNGSGDDHDEGTVITTDHQGNVIVAGYSTGEGTRRDYVTIKYDINGNLQWVQQYNGTGNSYDRITAIEVDAQGNIYVTGYSVGAGTDEDMVTIKYGANGNQIWLNRYNGSGLVRPSDIEVDAQGNVYIVNGSGGDINTVKYNSNGDQLWVRTYDGPAEDNMDDTPAALSLDSYGNVYVTGRSYGVTNNFDFVTLKYSPSGRLLWVSRYDRGDDRAVDVAADLFLEEVYITGSSAGDIVTIKYRPDGTEEWIRRYDYSSDSPTNLHLEGWGTPNVYVAGNSSGPVLIKYPYCYIPGDIDGNCCVDDADLLAVLFAFGQTGRDIREDLNLDRSVDDSDLLILLFNFGAGC